MISTFLSSKSVRSDLVAAASGHGEYCEDGVPTEAALLAILAAFAVSFAILYMASTTNVRRRKRDINLSDMLQDVMWKGKWVDYSGIIPSNCEKYVENNHVQYTLKSNWKIVYFRQNVSAFCLGKKSHSSFT